MISLRSTSAAALIAILVASCSSPAKPSVGPTSAATGLLAQGKPQNTAATLTFADRPGDAITSDGTSYSDGVGGVISQLLSGGQLGMQLRGTPRRLNFNLDGIISGSGPTGTLSDDTNVVANDVTSIAIGSSQPRRAIFNTSVGQFNFDTAADSQTNSAVVTHVDATTWTVETSGGDVAVLVQTVPDPHNPRKTITVTAGYYHLPFKFTGVTQ